MNAIPADDTIEMRPVMLRPGIRSVLNEEISEMLMQEELARARIQAPRAAS
jgi:hypothetical protein